MLDKDILEFHVHTLMELEEELAQIKERIENTKDILKKEMEDRGEYFLEGDGWSITWSLIASNRFDQSLFRAKNPELFKEYIRVSESRRFLLKETKEVNESEEI